MTGSTLKLIAIITMFIDHVGAAILGKFALSADMEKIYSLSRTVGRIAFPIFCFLLVEGFLHTKDIKKYLWRLGLFALISEVPFDLAINGCYFEFGHQNVFFTLFIGLLTIYVMDLIRKKKLSKLWYIYVPVALLMADMLQTDYSSAGVLVIIVMYLLRKWKWLAALAGCFLLYLFYGDGELPALAAFLPMVLYNGKKGKKAKYFYYWFYPAHLIVLYIIREFVLMRI